MSKSTVEVSGAGVTPVRVIAVQLSLECKVKLLGVPARGDYWSATHRVCSESN